MIQIFRIFFGFWSLLFLLFAYWQWNDPDPEVWVTIYVFATVMSALAAFNRYYTPLLIIAVIAGLLGGIYYFPQSVSDWIVQEWKQGDLSMKTLDMEEARESFGLLIVSFILSIAAYRGWCKKSAVK